MSTPYGPADLVAEVREWLKARTELDALEVCGLDLAPNLKPPSIVIGPPSWTLLTVASDEAVSRFRLTVYVVVSQTDEAFTQMLEHVQRVARALDEPAGTQLVEIRPTTFPAGGVELPAYAIDIEVTT